MSKKINSWCSKLIPIGVLLLCCGVNAHAQISSSKYMLETWQLNLDGYGYDEGGDEGEVAYGKQFTESLKAHSNDCAEYFNGYDSTSPLFKKITEYNYISDDSTLKNKKIKSTAYALFNKIGEKVLEVTRDSLGRTTDSIIYQYDDKYNKTRIITYGLTSPDSRWLVVNSDEIFGWSSKGNLVKDSVVMRRNEMSMYNMREFNTTTTRYEYDNEDNVVHYSSISDEDTTLVLFSYDKSKRMLTEKHYTSGAKWSYYYTRTDADSNVVEYKTVSDEDTNDEVYTYGPKHIMHTMSQYHNGKLNRMTEVSGQKDGGIMVTEIIQDAAPTEEGDEEEVASTCPNNTHSVSVYGKDSLLLNETTTTDKSGAPFTTTTVHIYRYDNKHNPIFDSAIITKKGDLYSSMYIQLTIDKLDSAGNLLEEVKKGGSEYGENSKETYKYNKLGNQVESDMYGACLDEPYSINKTIFYPDDKTEKETIRITGNSVYYNYFGEDSRKLRVLNTYPAGATETVYEYEQ